MKEANSIIEPASLFTRSKDKEITVTDPHSFSLFKRKIRVKNKKPFKNTTLLEVHNLIKSEILSDVTENIRMGKAVKELDLPFITCSCTCSIRSGGYVTSYTGILGVDIDHCDIDLKNIIAGDTFLSPALIFVSPRGMGLKIFIVVNNATAENHLKYLEALTRYFFDTYQLNIDQSCSDIVRACFLCHDPEAYYSTGSIDSEALLSILKAPQITTPPDKLSFDNLPDHRPSDELNRLPIVHSRAISALKSIDWQQNGEDWTRPDKSPKDGISAKFNIDPKDGLWKFTNWSDNGFPFATKTYTDTQIICLLEYGDNWTACIKQLVSEYLSQDIVGTFIDSTDETPPLPMTGFHPILQGIINEYNRVYGAHPDLIKGAILFATASSLGESVLVKNKFENAPIIWGVLVAPSGAAKTPGFDFAYKPLIEKDFGGFQKHKFKMDIYLAEVANQKKGSVKPAKPDPCAQNIIIDSTPEAIAKAMAANPRGITLKRDELNGFIQDIGRYAKSGEVENYLSTWSGSPFKVNRASGDNIFVKEPFLNICGGIQTGVLSEMAKDGRMINGFLQRFCFVFPDNMQAPDFSFELLSEDFKTEYSNYINKLLSLQSYRDPIYLDYDAQEVYADFFNKNVALNNSGIIPDYLKEVNAKLNIIVKRLALILHYSNWVYAEIPENRISMETMLSAIDMAEYFRITQNKVYKIISSQSGTEANKKTVAKYLSSIGNSQSDIAKVLKVRQSYISKILKQ